MSNRQKFGMVISVKVIEQKKKLTMLFLNCYNFHSVTILNELLVDGNDKVTEHWQTCAYICNTTK